MNIFIYHRPIHKEFYELLGEKYFPEYNIITLSDFKKSADIWLGEDNGEELNYQSSIFTETERNEILLRCRFLRNIDKNIAEKLIDNMGIKIDKLIKEYRPKYIIGAVIDNYTMDIMERLALEKNVPYVSFTGHFFSGYSWITRRGELNKMPRKVDDSEVNDVLNKILNKSYVPSYHKDLKPSIKEACFFYLKQMVKRYFYLPLRRFIEKDIWNYYYRTYFFEKANLLRIKEFVNKDNEKYFIKNSEVHYDKMNVLFPLHFRPEATTDYWCDDPICGSNYEESVIEVIKNSSNKVYFLVKEHPAMYMKRQRQFYERLLKFKNVKIIHPLENSNESLEKVDIVYVYTGSIGVEALLRDKLVIARSVSYYSNLHPNVHISNCISNDILEMSIKKYDHRKFVKDILQGTIKGTMYNNKKIMQSDKIQIFKQVKEYCDVLERNLYERI